MKRYLPFFLSPLALGLLCIPGMAQDLPAPASSVLSNSDDNTSVTTDATPKTPKTGFVASGASLTDVVTGKNFPLSVKLKDLGEGWRQMTVSSGLPAADQPTFAPTNPDPRGVDLEGHLMELMGIKANQYFTKGQTVVAGSDTFLVAYQGQPVRSIDALVPASFKTRQPTPEELTQTFEQIASDRTLSLTLLNVRLIGSLGQVRPYAWEQGRADMEATLAQAFKDESGSRDKARNASSLSNLKQIGLGLMQYAQDYDETLPAMKDAVTAKAALWPYIKSEQVFFYPSEAKTPYQPNAVLSKHKLAHISNPAQMVAYYEAEPASDGTRGVLFLDGHAQRISDKDEWPRLKKMSKIP